MKLRHDRAAEHQAWIASHQDWAAKCHTPSPAVAAPVRITGWEELGAAITVICPYCSQEHQHIVTPINWEPNDWTPEELLMGTCNQGCYIVSITPAK